MSKSLGEIWKAGKFAVVGVMNTLIDYGVFTLLTQVVLLNVYASQVIAFICGMLNSYIFNSRWTFGAEGRFFSPLFIRFLILNVCMLGLSTAFLAFFMQFTAALIAKGCSVILSMTISFLLNRFWVFRRVRGDVSED